MNKIKSDIVDLIAQGFTLHEACAKLEIQLSHVTDWLDADTVFKDYIAKAKKTVTQSMVDEAERQLMEAVRNGEKWAIVYYLDNQGKDKGYNVKEEPTTVINNNLSIPELSHNLASILNHGLNTKTIDSEDYEVIKNVLDLPSPAKHN